MHILRKWLFQTVAYQFTLKGMHGINIREMAAAGGVSLEQVNTDFPDKRALIFGLIDEICSAHKEIIARYLRDAVSPHQRAEAFITGSLEFTEERPDLSEVIVICLLGSETELKEHVHDVYATLFELLVDDLVADGVLAQKSRAVLADITVVLLSIIFLGGSPVLQMDYLSFVDPQKVALSTLSAMKKRYSSSRFA